MTNRDLVVAAVDHPIHQPKLPDADVHSMTKHDLVFAADHHPIHQQTSPACAAHRQLPTVMAAAELQWNLRQQGSEMHVEFVRYASTRVREGPHYQSETL